jgi:hypothetical protein
MKLIDKLIIEGLIYGILFSMYMIFSDKPFVYKYFWRTYYYVVIWSLPMVLFATVLPLAYDTFTWFLLWSLIIFFGELVLFNIAKANKDQVDFFAACTSQLYGYVFSGSIVVLAIVSLVIKFLK